MHISLSRYPLALTTLFVLIFLSGCKSVSQPSENKNNLEALVQQELGQHYTITKNTLNTLALCQQKRTGDHLLQKLNYIVVRIADNRIVDRGSYQNGHVKWIDDKSIEVLNGTRPGTELKKKIITISSN